MRIHANIEPLCWEKQFFGVNSAIICFNKDAPILTERELASWSRVQARIPAWQTEHLDALQHLGFQLVDGEVDFVIAVKTYYEDSGAKIAKKADIPVLRQIAADAFSQSRFRAPWYEFDASSKFYAQWIENAVLGAFDDTCLVFRDATDKINGFLSLRRLSDTEARIGLLAGRGIGEKLMQAALRWAQQQQLKTVRVATQVGNIAAIKRYITSGATVTTTAYWLYR